jgi:hypothetical protein
VGPARAGRRRERSPPAAGRLTCSQTDNYWGTADPDEVAEWIWDGNDDPEIRSVVNSLPMADGPEAAERTTWSGVKALYR